MTTTLSTPTNYMQKTRNELFYQRSYFAEAEWIDVLGEAAYCLWKKLITRVDRSTDAVSKYGNRNTVPFSLTRLAEILGMHVNTLKKHARTLWNAGLVDFSEWAGCYKLGKKPMNIVVYNYPQNDTANATKSITFVRDYDKQFEKGTYTSFSKELSAEIYAPLVNDDAPAHVLPTPVAPTAPTVESDYLDLTAFYALFDDTMRQAFDDTNREASDSMNGQELDGSNGQAADDHIYITNTLLTNSNDLLITPNTLNKSNVINNINSSSSSLNKNTNIEVNRLEEEEENNNLNKSLSAISELDIELLKNVLETALTTRGVSPAMINKIIENAVEKQIPYATTDLINQQLDEMGRSKAYGKVIYDFAQYFVNGLAMKVESLEFYLQNTPEQLSQRLFDEQQTKRTTKRVPFYNWLEEREDDLEVTPEKPIAQSVPKFYNWLEESPEVFA